jgi:hypothetical protein
MKVAKASQIFYNFHSLCACVAKACFGRIVCGNCVDIKLDFDTLNYPYFTGA